MESLKDTKELIKINGVQYHGSLESEDFFQSICGAFSRAPKACLYLENKYSIFLDYDQAVTDQKATKDKRRATSFVALFIVLIAFSVIVYVIYDKVYQRYMDDNLENIVK